MLGLVFSTLTTALRRRWGALGLVAGVAAGCGLFLAVAWSQAGYVTTTSARIGMWAAFVFGALITVIVPAAVIQYVERREPRPNFWRTVGYGLASTYLALLAGALAVVVVALLARLLHATPA